MWELHWNRHNPLWTWLDSIFNGAENDVAIVCARFPMNRRAIDLVCIFIFFFAFHLKKKRRSVNVMLWATEQTLLQSKSHKDTRTQTENCSCNKMRAHTQAHSPHRAQHFGSGSTNVRDSFLLVFFFFAASVHRHRSNMQSMCTLHLLHSQKRTNSVTTCRASSAWPHFIFRTLSWCRMHCGSSFPSTWPTGESVNVKMKKKNNFYFSPKLIRNSDEAMEHMCILLANKIQFVFVFVFAWNFPLCEIFIGSRTFTNLIFSLHKFTSSLVICMRIKCIGAQIAIKRFSWEEKKTRIIAFGELKHHRSAGLETVKLLSFEISCWACLPQHSHAQRK